MAESQTSYGTQSEKSRIAVTIATAKDLFGLLRDFAIGALVTLLLIFPTAVNNRLTEAGFEEGSFAGLKWRAKFVESDAGLKEARVNINDLRAQLNLTTDKLKDAAARINDPKFKVDVTSLDTKSKSLSAAAAKVESSVSNIISSNASLVEKAQSSSDGKWGVIWSGDTTLDLAKYEIDTIAPRLGIPNANIFLDMNGSYRSVSVVDSNEEARQVLAKAKQRRSDAYIVRISSWCPNSVQKEGFRACVRT